ncbi:MAG: signal peptidase I, partial [Erysipelotrichaceae bacterium]|nr:signal peptidase I [Erysipelotrichaceae bacterium]
MKENKGAHVFPNIREGKMKLASKHKLFLILLFVALVTLSAFEYVLYVGIAKGPSMSPTMSTTTWIFGNRLDTNYQIGDVVAARSRAWDNTQVVKRIWGLPGDKIIVDGMKVFVNDKQVSPSNIPISFTGFPYQNYTLGKDE